MCERACAGPPLSGPLELPEPDEGTNGLPAAPDARDARVTVDPRERSRAGGAELLRRAGVRIPGVKILLEAREDPIPTQYPEFGLAGLPAGRVREARGKW